MFTQKELLEIQTHSRSMQESVTNPVWIRAYERIEDSVSGLERLMEGSKMKEEDDRIEKGSATPNLLDAAIRAEKYMTEKGVSHEYPVMINLRAAIIHADREN